MRISNIYITASFIFLSLAITSCKKEFLEVVPKGQLVATTYDDYKVLMNSPDFYQFNSGGGYQVAMLMGDETATNESLFDSYDNTAAQALFQWQSTVYQPDEEPSFVRDNLMNLYVINGIINKVMKAPGGSEQQKLEIQAEAKATRAFIYFQFINYFGKPYNAATAANDPGFPLNTDADITKNAFVRNSVQEVYDFMIADLKAAIPNLDLQQPFATRWSKPAAEGFLGKLYLFMGKNAEALAMFNNAFNDIAAMPTPPRLYDYNVTFGTGGSFLPINSETGPKSPFNDETNLTESVVAMMYYGGDDNGNGVGNDFLIITPQTQALYGSTDWRLKFYSNTDYNGSPIAGGRLRKNGVQFMRFGLQLSELYLLRAEVKARLNDLTGAKADVEELRKKRMPATDAVVPSGTATNQTALVKFIIDERIREFASEGYRWFDMRRLSTDPIFSGQPAAVHNIYLTAGGTKQYTLKPERLTLQLPPLYLQRNQGMPDNP